MNTLVACEERYEGRFGLKCMMALRMQWQNNGGECEY